MINAIQLKIKQWEREAIRQGWIPVFITAYSKSNYLIHDSLGDNFQLWCSPHSGLIHIYDRTVMDIILSYDSLVPIEQIMEDLEKQVWAINPA